VTCPGTSVCRIIRGRAKCVSRQRCRLFCPRDYDPLCGTNGKTYSNRCMLERFACKRSLNVGFSYEGRCRGGSAKVLSRVINFQTVDHPKISREPFFNRAFSFFFFFFLQNGPDLYIKVKFDRSSFN